MNIDWQPGIMSYLFSHGKRNARVTSVRRKRNVPAEAVGAVNHSRSIVPLSALCALYVLNIWTDYILQRWGGYSGKVRGRLGWGDADGCFRGPLFYRVMLSSHYKLLLRHNWECSAIHLMDELHCCECSYQAWTAIPYTLFFMLSLYLRIRG